jgi:hypothetical protein
VSTPTTRSAWLDEQWRTAALAWIHERLADRGATVTGEITQPHVVPWSTAMRVPTDAGPVWFKANGAGTTYEPALLTALNAWAAEWTITALAADTERAWSLTEDGGEQLRARFAIERDLEHWERALPGHAELQRAVAPHVAALLKIGVPDLRPETMPGHLGALLDNRAAMRIGQQDGLTEDQYTRLRALEPEYARWCAELAGSGVAPSLQHDDLHDNNVLIGADGRYRFFDWGDAGVAHPFGVLLVALRSIGYAFEFRAGSPELTRLRDAYLEPWTAEHDRAHLVAVSEVAIRVAKVGRSLAWHRVLAPLTDADAGEYTEAVPGWLAELFEPDLP